MDETPNPITMSQLCEKGHPLDSRGWCEGDPDYVTDFGLRPEHIPALVEIVHKWTERDELAEDEWHAPIHAWRALGQLRAVEAVDLLLNMQNRCDESEGDWYLTEFHEVFGLIGPPAVAALSEYLADRNNAEFPRVSVVNGLSEIGTRHPETRDHIIEVLTTQLASHEPEVYHLNSFVVDGLKKLKASESAEVIERAFAAHLIIADICGEWAEIRDKLGVTELGLVPDRPKPPLRFARGFDDLPLVNQLDRDQRKQAKKRAKAKRKQQKQSRKRNRKRR